MGSNMSSKLLHIDILMTDEISGNDILYGVFSTKRNATNLGANMLEMKKTSTRMTMLLISSCF